MRLLLAKVSLITGFIIGGVFCGEVHVTATGYPEDYRFETYWSEGTTVTVTCLLKHRGSVVEFTWSKFNEDKIHVLSENTQLLPEVAAETGGRYTIDDASTDQHYRFILRISDAKPWESGKFGCRSRSNEKVKDSGSQGINIAGRIDPSTVQLFTSPPVIAGGYLNVANASTFSATCVSNAANIPPVIAISLGDGRDLRKYIHNKTVTTLRQEKVRELDMYEVRKKAIFQLSDVVVTCDDHLHHLTCSATAPVSQVVMASVKVKVVGCGGAGSLTSSLTTALVAMVILFSNIGCLMRE